MPEFLAAFEDVEGLLKALPDAPDRLASLFQYLRASEAKLLALINSALAGEKHVSPPAETEGDLEFGLVLHWLQFPRMEHVSIMQSSRAHAIATQALQRLAPPSGISQDVLASFAGIAYRGYVAADGTLYTLGKYAQLDPLWLTAAVNYVINLLDPPSIYHPFPTSPYHATIGAGKDSIRIAIVGDWGSGVYDQHYAGQGPAVAVMNAVRNLKPDYVIHLGDVYYCGTNERLPMHEEQHKLLDLWQTGTGTGTSFTLNSNHEMYGAAQGLIRVALAGNTPFQQQNGTTYFGLDFGNWVILGLDSAYFDPSHLYMQGALGNASNTQQQDFIRNTYGNLGGKKVFALTHHNPMSFDGASMVSNQNAGTSLWDGMNAALGKKPEVWYWGHLHLGVVYNANSVVGAQGTLGRCVGHSAIPFGNAHGMIAGNVDYYAHTPLSDGAQQVQNGFAVVTLGANGSLAEAFYEVDVSGKCTQKWSNP